MSEVREAYQSVGRDLLRLLFFVEMNAVGLRKILKKFDKHLGYGFTAYYVKTRANHPYSQLQQIFKHVVLLLVYTHFFHPHVFYAIWLIPGLSVYHCSSDLKSG